jgi:hypothetical protein
VKEACLKGMNFSRLSALTLKVGAPGFFLADYWTVSGTLPVIDLWLGARRALLFYYDEALLATQQSPACMLEILSALLSAKPG